MTCSAPTLGAGVHNDITVPDVHRIGPVAEKIEIVDGGALAVGWVDGGNRLIVPSKRSMVWGR